jgi:LysR family hydrogen peroxide-inducible transcriptional activator
VQFAPPPITLRQLQYLVAVADLLSFGQAARRCGVSQPSLSAQVAEAERQLGVQVFERDTRHVRVTAAGAAIVSRAKAMLLATDDLVSVAQGFTDPMATPFSIGVIPTIGPYLLPDLDPALRQRWPSMRLHWVEERTDKLVEQVKEGRLDAALLALEADIGDLAYEVFGTDSFVVGVPAGHPLSGQGSLGPADIAGREILVLADGHCFGDQVADVCGLTGATSFGFRATSLSTLVQMAAGRQCLTVLPSMAVEVENRRNALKMVPFSGTTPHRTLVLAWRPSAARFDSLKAIADVARHVARHG